MSDFSPRTRTAPPTPAPRCVARERPAPYAAEGPSVASVLEQYRQAREALAALDLDACSDEEMCELLAAVVNEQTALAAAESRVIPTFDSKAAFRHDANVTTPSWLRWKVGLGYADAQRRWKRAKMLRRLPVMAAAFDKADISTAHVDAVVHRAVPARLDRLAEHDETSPAGQNRSSTTHSSTR